MVKFGGDLFDYFFGKIIDSRMFDEKRIGKVFHDYFVLVFGFVTELFVLIIMGCVKLWI